MKNLNADQLKGLNAQFHYVPEGTLRIEDEDRMAVFGSEGKNVTC